MGDCVDPRASMGAFSVVLRPVFGPWPPRSPSSNLLYSLLLAVSYLQQICGIPSTSRFFSVFSYSETSSHYFFSDMDVGPIPSWDLTGLRLVKKFPTFYGTRRFITTFTGARDLTHSWARSIQSIPRTENPTPLWRIKLQFVGRPASIKYDILWLRLF
jgi:hypothetical protein